MPFNPILKSPTVSPYPRLSSGLTDAYTDLSGGDFLQDNVSGSQAALNFNNTAAQFNVTAGGPTGKQIIIPSNWKGGNVTWVRGLYALSAVPRYADFMADFNAGDTTNYADFTQVATNNYSGGVLSTAIPVLAAVVLGTTLQAYYSYRTTTTSLKGQAMSGWPQLHIDPYQGTANDGDNYLMFSWSHAFNTIGNTGYKKLRDKIGNSLLAAGKWSSNILSFSIPFSAEAGQYGIYWFNALTTPFTIDVVPRPDGVPGNCLKIVTTVLSGGPPYNSAGWGAWPTFPVTALSPFNSLDFSLYGDGSSRNIQISTTVDAGGMSALVPLMPAWGGGFHNYSLLQSDFWKTSNVVYDSKHADYQFITPYGSNSYSIVNFVDTVNNKIIKEFDFDFTGNGAGYAGIVFGAAPGSSAGTTNFNFDFYSQHAGVVVFTAQDNTATKYACSKTVIAGWQSISIPWVGAAGVGFAPVAFTHPAVQFYAEPTNAMSQGAFRVDNARYDAVVTMASAPITFLSGFQFNYPSNSGGAYTTYFNNVTINQPLVDGPDTDVVRYSGIPRWTYKWNKGTGWIGYGSWRGPSAVGYSWLAGWQQSGIVNFDNGRVVSSMMLDFLTDSQNAYKTQFPAKQIGPFIPRYGRASWEALTTGGYVAGVWTTNTLNKWYHPSTDDWYGYMYRALLAVAQYYYYTQSAQAKTILDNWMAWLDVYIIADGLYWKPPSDFYNDGTVGYTSKPVYAYATIAAACMYKYFVDGDALALKWYRRLLDDIYTRQRQTTTGTLAGLYTSAEGINYTTANIVFTCDGIAPTATAFIAGGKITHCTVVTPGSGMTYCTASIVGDGIGAQCNAYLSDLLVGAFSTEHTGWEAAEIFNTYALLVNGPPTGGHTNHILPLGPNDLSAFIGLYNFYQRAKGNTRPSMLNSDMIPYHEFNVGSWHQGAGIENPMISDTHAKGAMWTETIAPTVFMAVEWGRYSGDYSWVERLFNLVCEYTEGIN